MRLTIVWGYGVAAAASLFLLLAGPFLIDAMTTSASVRAAARDFLLFAALVPVAGTLAYQMDGVFIGATWSSDMRNMMLLSLAAYLGAWWALSGPLGVAGLWVALLIFLGLRGLTLLWRSRAAPAWRFLRALLPQELDGRSPSRWRRRRGLRPRQLFRSREPTASAIEAKPRSARMRPRPARIRAAVPGPRKTRPV